MGIPRLEPLVRLVGDTRYEYIKTITKEKPMTPEFAKDQINTICGDRKLFVIQHARLTRGGYKISVLCADENGEIHADDEFTLKYLFPYKSSRLVEITDD